ncbi:MAG: transaldolase, partial [Planctomycetes bacterium]|nr:transaldolase [Planctomycetota bacterium]
MTSNPTIFMKAITGSADYDTLFAQLVQADPSDMEIYEGLVLPDIRDAADILGPLYEESGGTDGFISLEVSPKLAYQTDQTIAQGRRLWQAVDRPNLMIKVPATPQGLGAIEALIGQGINVNVTLIFSVNVYRQVIAAYLKGLKAFDDAGGDLSRVASVASFFVSRLDAAVDKIIDQKIASDPSCTQSSGLAALKGKAAVANAKIAYAVFKEHFANVASPLVGDGSDFDL